ncbi:hypothetical protein M0805_005915 [Coniferiporia weirii]|nr:hypothetical protein M0805_005915 [Coniferiporia weirii]
MARDRLAALRGMQQVEFSYGGSGAQSHYELSQMTGKSSLSDEDGGMLDDAFYNEIREFEEDLHKFDANVKLMSTLHSQQLDTVDLGNGNTDSQLESVVEETRSLSATLKRRIAILQSQPVDARAANIRRPQIERVKTKFMDAIQNYQSEEKSYRDRHKDRLIRQYKIVNPNATPEDIEEVVSGDSGAQIFSQAMLGDRRAGSQSAYREVQKRHEEIKKIEGKLVELAELFNDVSQLVEQQGDTINVIEEKTILAGADIEAGKGFTDKAVVSARSARQKRWICFILTLIILIIIAAVVGCEVSNKCHTN